MFNDLIGGTVLKGLFIVFLWCITNIILFSVSGKKSNHSIQEQRGKYHLVKVWVLLGCRFVCRNCKHCKPFKHRRRRVEASYLFVVFPVAFHSCNEIKSDNCFWFRKNHLWWCEWQSFANKINQSQKLASTPIKLGINFKLFWQLFISIEFGQKDCLLTLVIFEQTLWSSEWLSP